MFHKPSKRTVVIVILVVVVLGLANVILRGNPTPDQTVQAPPTTQPSSPTPAPPTSSPASQPTTGPVAPSAQQAEIADQAIAAVSQLAGAMLLDRPQMQPFVNQYVSPGQRQTAVAGLSAAATGLVQDPHWGYASVQDANELAQYYLTVQKYRIDELTPSTATVSLFEVSHWVSSTGQEYLVPEISVVRLEKDGNRWYYLGSGPPSANDRPGSVAGLTYNQTIGLYQPFLKGFTDVSSAD